MQQQQLHNWVLCVDPDSHNIYTLNITTYKVLIETNYDMHYRMKADKAIADLESITHLNNGYWLSNSVQLDHYRRRQIPSYLLHPKQSKYLQYLSTSQMNSAYSMIHSIKIIVHLKHVHESLNARSLKLEVTLLTSADQAITRILNQVKSILPTDIDINIHNNHYILQVQGFREYIYGNHPLIQFTRIRTLLRDQQQLEVLLLQSHEHTVYDYPTIIQRQHNHIKCITDWSQYANVPIFLWYPPFKLPDYDKLTHALQQNIPRDSFHSLELKSVIKSSNKQVMTLQQRVDKAYQQYKINSTKQDDIINSGECDYPLQFQLFGIDKLSSLLESDYSKLGTKRATYNGQMPLYNITKLDDGVPPFQVPMSGILSLNGKELKDDGTNSIRKMSDLHHIPFGGIEYKGAMEQMHIEYGLDFVPFLISVKVTIYYADTYLINEATLESNKVPFTFQPRFNHWFKYPQLKLSQLPLETRLCFDIIIYSKNGLMQTIGSTSIYLFDHLMIFQQGLNTLNIWPFYKTNPRMMCQSHYKGQSGKYTQLQLQMPSFVSKVKWSRRDTNKQVELGFPKESNNLKFYADIIRNDPKILELIEKKKKPEYRQSLLKSSLQATVNLIKRKALIEMDSSRENSKRQSTILQPAMSFIQQILQTRNQLITKSDKIGQEYPYKDWVVIPNTEDLAYLQTLLKCNPLDRQLYTQQDKYILMICRNHFKTLPSALQILLLAINWADPTQAREAQRILQEWVPLPSELALPLLDAHYADANVRFYAVERISLMSDDELILFMLQLSQALQFEQNHCSALGELLLERCMNSPYTVGHELFWLLKSSLHIKPSYERFAAILEQLIMLSGEFREHIIKELQVNETINRLAMQVKQKQYHDMPVKIDVLREELSLLQIDKPFSIPLDSRMLVYEFVIEKCSVLNSKKLPLTLCMTTSEDNNSKLLQVIFKNGDDLKQDLLTLQLIKIMDKIWMDAGMDFKLKPYKVIATDDQVGMIEVVLDAHNISKIHESAGTLGAFDQKAISNFLRMHNSCKDDYEQAKDNFLRSCAGYCVATYILGIGDRHSGNIMLTSTGHLFHIDFGHFLGNFKSKFGINRERAKFVLTPEMAFVMGGQESETFKCFEEHCVNAYNTVRKHGQFLIDIFLMNLSAGIPELQSAMDVRYLEDMLALKLSEQEATAKFRQQLVTAQNDLWRPIDNFFHTLKRKG